MKAEEAIVCLEGENARRQPNLWHKRVLLTELEAASPKRATLITGLGTARQVT